MRLWLDRTAKMDDTAFTYYTYAIQANDGTYRTFVIKSQPDLNMGNALETAILETSFYAKAEVEYVTDILEFLGNHNRLCRRVLHYRVNSQNFYCTDTAIVAKLISLYVHVSNIRLLRTQDSGATQSLEEIARELRPRENRIVAEEYAVLHPCIPLALRSPLNMPGAEDVEYTKFCAKKTNNWTIIARLRREL